MRVIDAAEVRRRLGHTQCMALMREAMLALSTGLAPKTQRSALPVGAGLFGVMPGILGGEQTVFGAKLLGIFPDPQHPAHRRHRGVVVLFDGASGAPLCVADAEEITTLRTAAASALATETLARANARRLAILGCGTQALSHLAALSSCRRYDAIRVWGRDAAKAQRFAGEAKRSLGLNVEVAATARAAAEPSDVICTVTSAAEPILEGRWLQAGTHVNVVGSSVAGPAEVDDELVVRSRYYVDSRPSALAQAAEFLRAKAAGRVADDHIAGEIGEVLAGLAPGRRSAEELTVYKSLGHIVQDLAAVRFLHRSTLEP